MKLLVIFALLFTIVQAADVPDTSTLYRAAQDELARSIKELKIEKQERPYYISYRIEDKHITEISARFGSLMFTNTSHSRDAFVDVRVNNYDLDNSNFICQTRSMDLIDSDKTALPLEDDYYAIRQALWIVTDGTYKKALERLARKIATLQNQPRKDTVPDFSKVEPTTIFEPIRTTEVDISYWAETVKRASEVFKEFPKIQESEVRFKVRTVIRYFLDTEGNQSRTMHTLSMLEVAAKTQSTDGDPLENQIGFHGLVPMDLPDTPALLQSIRAMAETLCMQVSIAKEEDYSGPVMFVGQAAAELFFQVLGKGISDPRTPLYENDMIAQTATSGLGTLAKRLGRRVMSNFLSAVDDPTIIAWEGVPLVGHYRIDDEGVPAQPVEVAIDGKLLSLLMSRAPTKRMRTTNGHGRYRDEDYGPRTVGLIANLIITATEPYRTSDLKTELIDICKEYEIPYGIVITRLMPTKPLTTKDFYLRYFRTMSGGGGEDELLSMPVIAYRIDAESGTATLIRGLTFSDVTPRVLRDILVTGQENYLYNFIYRDEHGNTYPMSVVAPAVLVEEMDLVGTDTKPTKLPILTPPFPKK
jgi:TldD protein